MLSTDDVAPFPLFLQMLVVKVFAGPLSQDGGGATAMKEEVETMTRLQELGVPFEGTLVASSTTEWKRIGKFVPAIVMKSAGR